VVEEAAEVDDRRCRFLVRLAGPPAAPVADALGALAAADRLAGLMAPASSALATLARELPTALLATDGEPADGALIDVRGAAAQTVEASRARARDAILLAAVGTSRHDAMEAGEAGADALLFGGEPAEVRDCVAWWSELFVLPVAAPAPTDGPRELVLAGVDFLVVEAAALVDPADPLEALLERLTAAEAERSIVPPPA
jgi:thiamine-phosphate pyrophosphorylase